MKDVTPKKQQGFIQKFGIGLLGGLVGSALVLGGAFLLWKNPTASQQPSTKVSSPNSETTVSNVNVDVKSDVSTAVDKVSNAVVSVINLQTPAKNGFDGLFGGFTENSGSGEESSLEAASEGSGVIYKKTTDDTAFVVTNNHVVDGAEALEVVLHDGTKVEGTLVGTDSYTDLAVIKIASDKVTTIAEFGNSDNLKVGEPAIAIGSPLGSDYANSVTQGIISSVNRNIQNQNDSGEIININAIQTDAAINPGNSGGPLVNIEGQVIGINSVKIVQSNSQVNVEGMGFAIPSNDAVNIINQLEQNGKVTRPALGISMDNLTAVSQQQKEQILKVPNDLKTGIIVISVKSAAPADKAGIEKYDVITKVDGKEVDSVTDLQSALYKKSVGDTMEVTFYRKSEEKTVTVELSIDQSALQTKNN